MNLPKILIIKILDYIVNIDAFSHVLVKTLCAFIYQCRLVSKDWKDNIITRLHLRNDIKFKMTNIQKIRYLTKTGLPIRASVEDDNITELKFTGLESVIRSVYISIPTTLPTNQYLEAIFKFISKSTITNYYIRNSGQIENIYDSLFAVPQVLEYMESLSLTISGIFVLDTLLESMKSTTRLRSLKINYTRIILKNAEVLETHFPTLTTISLYRTPSDIILPILRHAKNLLEFSVSSCGDDIHILGPIFEEISNNKSLTSLSVDDNNLILPFHLFSQLLNRNQTLTKLNMSFSALSTADTNTTPSKITNHTLLTLGILSDNMEISKPMLTNWQEPNSITSTTLQWIIDSKLLDILEYFPKLRSLEYTNKGSGDGYSTHFLSLMNKNLPNLKSISIYSLPKLIGISTLIAKNTYITTLGINCRISYTMLLELLQCDHPTLTSITTYVDTSPLIDFISFAQILGNNRKITQLYLLGDLYITSTPDIYLYYLSHILEKNYYLTILSWNIARKFHKSEFLATHEIPKSLVRAMTLNNSIVKLQVFSCFAGSPLMKELAQLMENKTIS
ncbi:hypothetical protein DLAC_03196 [Tieghemostelium lacteum]|uniref:F-box domain-containing protein n=1 Tax=Tieghemostelium lacteum TaxID=361077 RepID=A0A152A1B0_TIELA|nr:hypothetical protein DLAC_03196 [Tieghemostelium lacteum]|eukprot:KYR00053.1 hypothetical protein DLAC_03196 [Tieghemostelium lacteum]